MAALAWVSRRYLPTRRRHTSGHRHSPLRFPSWSCRPSSIANAAWGRRLASSSLQQPQEDCRRCLRRNRSRPHGAGRYDIAIPRPHRMDSLANRRDCVWRDQACPALRTSFRDSEEEYRYDNGEFPFSEVRSTR